MSKKFFSLLVFLFFLPFLAYSQDKFTPIIDKDKQAAYLEFAELHYCVYSNFFKFPKNTEPQKLQYGALGAIICLKPFIQDELSENRFFLYDAKLIAAGLYGYLYQLSKKKYPSMKLWKEESNNHLMDIIRDVGRKDRKKGHLPTKHFDIMKGERSQEPIVAIALYNLAVWNNSLHFLRRLIIEYPTSEHARKAIEILKKIGRLDLIFGKEFSKKELKK